MVNEENPGDEVESSKFEKLKSMELPRKVVVGSEALEELGETCTSLKLKRDAKIICDKTTREVAGDRAAEILEGFDYSVHMEEIGGATQEVVDGIVDTSSDEIDFLIGVGGGVPIDVAKYSSYLMDIPFLSVPTAASHDGVASGRASINRNGNKVSVGAHPPLAILADTGILADSPPRLMASGCADIIANATAVKDWILAKKLRSEAYSHYAANLSKMTADSMIENADSIKTGLEESAWMVVKALLSSSVAMSIAGSSRPASGSEHKFSHSLDNILDRPALHGEQCGVGTIIMMYLHGGDWKKIKKALEYVGAPTTARGLDISEEKVIDALVEAPEIRAERYTILGNRRMDRDAAEAAAKETGVI